MSELDNAMQAWSVKAGLIGAVAALDLLADTFDEYALTQNAVARDTPVFSLDDVARLIRVARDRTERAV